MFVSLADIIGSEYFVTLWKSLTKIGNNKGPKLSI